MQSQANAEFILKFILVVSKIQDYIHCKNYRKCCCVYSEKSLTHKE